jgi:hypothetical protein
LNHGRILLNPHLGCTLSCFVLHSSIMHQNMYRFALPGVIIMYRCSTIHRLFPRQMITAADFPVFRLFTSSHLLPRRYTISTFATVRMVRCAVNFVTYTMRSDARERNIRSCFAYGITATGMVVSTTSCFLSTAEVQWQGRTYISKIQIIVNQWVIARMFTLLST